MTFAMFLVLLVGFVLLVVFLVPVRRMQLARNTETKKANKVVNSHLAGHAHSCSTSQRTSRSTQHSSAHFMAQETATCRTEYLGSHTSFALWPRRSTRGSSLGVFLVRSAIVRVIRAFLGLLLGIGLVTAVVRIVHLRAVSIVVSRGSTLWMSAVGRRVAMLVVRRRTGVWRIVLWGVRVLESWSQHIYYRRPKEIYSEAKINDLPLVDDSPAAVDIHTGLGVEDSSPAGHRNSPRRADRAGCIDKDQT